ncbi:MAG: hypothetical protein IJV27_04315 [Prevotella sp.]|nr:hypothetical protein [Prevotella sp.]
MAGNLIADDKESGGNRQNIQQKMIGIPVENNWKIQLYSSTHNKILKHK